MRWEKSRALQKSLYKFQLRNSDNMFDFSRDGKIIERKFLKFLILFTTQAGLLPRLYVDFLQQQVKSISHVDFLQKVKYDTKFYDTKLYYDDNSIVYCRCQTS